MSDETKRYNGWANYETWCVHLWLTNEEGSYRYWREEAARHRSDAASHANVKEGIWSVQIAERAGLADQLKSEIEEASPIEGASLFVDLLNAAISEVDWREVAEAFLEELDPEDEGPDGSDDARKDEHETDSASINADERGSTEMKIMACNITPLPNTFGDPLPRVEVTLENGETKTLFEYYHDEIDFEPSEFVGLTVAEAMRLKSEKDVAYIRT